MKEFLLYAMLCPFCVFITRFNDIDVTVRRTCVQASQEFIVNQPDLIKDISGKFGAQSLNSSFWDRLRISNSLCPRYLYQLNVCISNSSMQRERDSLLSPNRADIS